MLETPESDEIARDIDEALHWYTEAANEGYANSIYHLGAGYYQGGSFGQDDALASEWLSIGSRRGDVNSQAQLGLMYANGRGFERDLKRGMMWLLVSLRFGHDDERQVDVLNKIAAALPYEDVKQAEHMAQECIMGFFEHC